MVAAAAPVYVQLPDAATLILAGLVGWLVARIRRKAACARAAAHATAALRAELAATASASSDVRQVVVVGGGDPGRADYYDLDGEHDDDSAARYDRAVLQHQYDKRRRELLARHAAGLVDGRADDDARGRLGRALGGHPAPYGDPVPVEVDG